MKLSVTEGAPLNLSYPYTDRLAVGDVFEVDDEKGEALLEAHDYLARAPKDAAVTDDSDEDDPRETAAESDDPPADEDDLTELDGVGPARADELREAGYESYADLRAASADELAAIDGVSEDAARAWQASLAATEGEAE
jgi:predicted flap endonuclease-1-like 5' DNA nuclease